MHNSNEDSAIAAQLYAVNNGHAYTQLNIDIIISLEF